MYRGEGPWSARTHVLDVLDGASSEAEVLSVSEAGNVCWLEDVEEGVDVTKGEPPHGTFILDDDEGANSFSAICDAGDGNLALAACGRSYGDATVGSEVVLLYDFCSGCVVRLFGHAPAPDGYIRQVGSLSAAPREGSSARAHTSERESMLPRALLPRALAGISVATVGGRGAVASVPSSASACVYGTGASTMQASGSGS